MKITPQASVPDRVALARAGENPFVIARLKSGWVVASDRPLLPGYCLLLSDPVVPSLNALGEAQRIQYSLDVIRVGDALIKVIGAHRINYETLCNLDPSLHTHIIPRYLTEPDEKRRMQASRVYDGAQAAAFDPALERVFMDKMKAELQVY